MNYTFCFRCSYQNKPEKDCPACGGKNRVFGTCFVCPMCVKDMENGASSANIKVI